MYKFLDKLYDRTVIPSYTSLGYKLRSKHWQPLPDNLEDKLYMVTGATSGIGKAIVEDLARRKARVVMICRSAQKGQKLQNELIAKARNNKIMLEMADMSSLESLERLAYRLVSWYPKLDALILNAGMMTHEHQMTEEGIELTFATNVVGGFLLQTRLLPLLKKTPDSRVVHVTSGGMYTQKIHVDSLELGDKNYDGVRAYAQSKRAQVILSRQWAKILQPYGISSNCMHPGWADTPGLQTSLPRFYKIFRKILRTPAQGADTAIWLATASEVTDTGKLWFDRAPKKEYISQKTQESPEEAQKLWELVEKLAKVNVGQQL